MACQAAEKHPSVTECLLIHAQCSQKESKKVQFCIWIFIHLRFHKKKIPKLYDGDINLTIKELANAVQAKQGY